MSKRKWFWLIFLAGMAIRLYGISNPLLDNQAWRQADTASMAANFLQHGFFPPFPQLNYDGPPPNFVELEFPIIPLLTAILWSIFGQFDIIARIVVLGFTAATFGFVYRLGRELYDETSGLLAMVFFALNPLAIYFGRTVMPDAAMICFMTATAYYMVRWSASNKLRDLLLSAVAFTLAGLAKLPALMMGLPLFVLILQRYKGTFLKQKALWLFLAIGLLPTFLYYGLAHLTAAGYGNQYVSGIVQNQLTGNAIDFKYLNKTLEAMITLPLFVIGVAAPFVRKARIGNLFVWVWLGIVLVYTVTVGARIQLNYYLLPLVPLLSVLAGGTLGRAWGKGLAWGKLPVVIGTLAVFAICAYIVPHSLKYYYNVSYAYLDQAKLIEQYTKPSDLLVLDDAPPMTLYFSDRKGWRLLPEKQTPQALELLLQNGAKLFVVLPGSTVSPGLENYLKQHFVFVPKGNFYDLRKAKV